MKKLILPAVIALVGMGAGMGVGHALRPPPEPVEDAAYGDDDHGADHGEAKAAKGYGDKGHGKKDDHGGGHDDGHGGGGDVAYVPLEKPIFVPLSTSLGKPSLVRLEIHLEVEPGFEETATHHEPKLRDSFLRTMLGHVEKGAFAANGTPDDMTEMRAELLADAQRVLGRDVHNVLIAEILHHGG